MVLVCQYWVGNHSKTTFFKNGAENFTSPGSDRVIKMTLENVTQEDEGFYKCASQDRKMESPEAWLSVSPHRGQLNGSMHLIKTFLILLSILSVKAVMVNNINCCLLGNFTSTDERAASNSGNMILYSSYIHLLVLEGIINDNNYCKIKLFVNKGLLDDNNFF